jgi:NAD(P)-dependent dehydrogenase (short-subunit alcohol dehydrogenase family)
VVDSRRPHALRQLRIIVTGCSSGIGRETALAAAALGHRVVATARHLDAIVALKRAGCAVLALDVTDTAAMPSAWNEARSLLGGVDVLVNNAGYGLYGTVEEQSIDDVRLEFETNFFGPARLAQLALPQMRAQGFGRIINVSSMAGRTAFPGGGYYHASKYALEALSDALRLEVAPFGVDVILIEPGPVRTAWTDVALSHLLLGGAAEDSPYDAMRIAIAAKFTSINSGPIPWYGSDPQDVAKVIVRAAERRRPKARYLIGGAAHVLVRLHQWLPDRIHDGIVRKLFGIERHQKVNRRRTTVAPKRE